MGIIPENMISWLKKRMWNLSAFKHEICLVLLQYRRHPENFPRVLDK